MKKKKWWMVLNPYRDGLKPTIRHEYKSEAMEEAERIALKTGKKIHVLELVGTMEPPKQHVQFIEAE